jgi:ribonuclease HI
VFDELKRRVTTEPVLAHPILTDPFELEVDASGFAMGAVLLQKKEDGKKHPIAYYSKTLSAAERNYDIYDLELLAIVNALDHWRSYLAGSPHKVIIYSDHQNLLYWKEPHKISRRVAREVLMLSEYNFEIRHIKGTANGRADALSRRPDYDQGQEDNQDVTVLPEQVFARAMEVLPDIPSVTDLQGPPSERTPEEKLWDFKTRAQQYARDRESCDDVRISYLEFLETEAEDDLALARMIAG